MKMLKILGYIVLALATYGQLGAQVHPKKAGYSDAQQWPATAPGDVKLKNFHPFRAVYQRSYRQGSGPGKGQQRQDHVIVTAENVAWHGKPAILINVLDVANTEYDDTNARSLFMYVDREDLSIVLEVGPLPGKAKDYYIARKMEDKMVLTMVTSEDGNANVETMPTSARGFGPGTWVMACMDLKKDLKIRLDPHFSPAGNAVSGMKFARIIGQKSYKDASGKKYNAWVAEAMWGLSNAKVIHRYLIDKPPYYLGTDSINLDSGEKKEFARLTEFSFLGTSSSGSH